MSHAAPKQASGRLLREIKAMHKSPPENIVACPLPENILEWHYVIYGLTDCPYAGGYYYGRLVFPREYPMKPPAIYMVTPNGRFATNTRLCLSMSDFHPETWNPAWSVETILKGLMSFMLEATPTAGSVTTTEAKKREFARKSLIFNLKADRFKELFPELSKEIRAKLKASQQSQTRSTSSSTPSQQQSSPNFVLPAIAVGLAALFAYLANHIITNANTQ